MAGAVGYVLRDGRLVWSRKQGVANGKKQRERKCERRRGGGRMVVRMNVALVVSTT
jgi:hypothetical protein